MTGRNYQICTIMVIIAEIRIQRGRVSMCRRRSYSTMNDSVGRVHRVVICRLDVGGVVVIIRVRNVDVTLYWTSRL